MSCFHFNASRLRLLLFFGIMFFARSLPFIPSSEFDALKNFYDSTNGDNWLIYGVQWNFSGYHNPCYENWQGISCTCRENNMTNIQPFSIYAAPGYVYYYDDSLGTIGAICFIEKIFLGFTNLMGTLPDSIGNFSFLSHLHIESNSIRGTIPSSLTTLILLQDLQMQGNFLTGTMPSSLGSIVSLRNLGLYANSLTGSICSSICDLKNLTSFLIHQNRLSGILPSCLGALSRLYILFVNDNLLSGPIPGGIGYLTAIAFLDMDSNYLTSTIATSVENLNSLAYLTLSSNYLQGSIPLGLGSLSALLYLQLNDNFLSGSLIRGQGAESWGRLQNLWLYSNLLTGTIPCSYSAMSALTNLLIQNNYLTGALGCFVNASVQQALSVIDVSDNQLTGAIPAELFRVKELSSLAAVKNCLLGSLPSNICMASTLQVLVLDGLNTAAACQQRYFPTSPTLTSYSIESSLASGLPACLFKMPNLETLHLSGNGITGTIPNSLIISENLQNLFLGFNQLSGTIPLQIQGRSWQNLQLTSNKFSGTLTSGLKVDRNTSLDLGVNRLSGLIPSSLRYLHNVSVLNGNMFDCAASRISLPLYDNYNKLYACASNSFDIGIYIWVGFVCLVGLILLLGKGRLVLPLKLVIEFHLEHVKRSLRALSEAATPDPAVARMRQSLVITAQFSILLLILECMVLAPIYAALNAVYRNHEFVYAWSVSVAYISGEAPAIVLVVVWLVTFGVFQAMEKHLKLKNESSTVQGVCQDSSSSSAPMQEDDDREWQQKQNDSMVGPVLHLESIKSGFEEEKCGSGGSDCQRTSTTARMQAPQHKCGNDMLESAVTAAQDADGELQGSRPFVAVVCLVLFNVTAVSIVNAGYVYLLMIGVPFQVETALQIILAMFKLAWKEFALPYMFQVASKFRRTFQLNPESSIPIDGLPDVQQPYQVYDDSRGDLLLRITYQCLIVFNNIVIPCATVAFINVNCFHYIFFVPESVVSSYQFTSCNILFLDSSGSCYQYSTTTLSTAFDPPFVYNFQCSAGVLTTYASVFVYSAIMTTFCLVPCRYFYPWIQSCFSQMKVAADGYAAFDKIRLVTRVINTSAVILTFGIVFPPVGVVMCAALLAELSLTAISIGRFLLADGHILQHAGAGAGAATDADGDGGAGAGAGSCDVHSGACTSAADIDSGANTVCDNPVADANAVPTPAAVRCDSPLDAKSGSVENILRRRKADLAKDSAHVREWMTESLRVTVPASAAFCSCFLFDILGDAVGALKAVWAPLVLLLVPVAIERLFGFAAESSFLGFLHHWYVFTASYLCHSYLCHDLIGQQKRRGVGSNNDLCTIDATQGDNYVVEMVNLEHDRGVTDEDREMCDFGVNPTNLSSAQQVQQQQQQQQQQMGESRNIDQQSSVLVATCCNPMSTRF